ncbi:hypothetical protein [Tissierella sp.]|nr:hypothetical protein [Tissierella sp.]
MTKKSSQVDLVLTIDSFSNILTGYNGVSFITLNKGQINILRKSLKI